jgi:FKBP-type peptidyl-prolyl cis-trans isomerase FkpA/FKBP-type peptidyl-prolyl cis-trans isomerase FklB
MSWPANLLSAVLVSAPLLSAAEPAPAKAPALATDREKILYVMGALLGRPVSSLDLSEADVALVAAGLADSASRRPLRASAEEWGLRVSEFSQKRVSEIAAAEKKKATPFFGREEARPGTRRQPEGFLYREVAAGTGPSPSPTGKVFISYTGTIVDGTVFETTSTVGRPVTFDLERVIPCWQKALPLMKAGGKARIVCPSELAWGDFGHPPHVKPGAPVVFDLELVQVLK